MKVKEGFILKDVGDASVVVAVGKQANNFKGVITLNESAKVLWLALSEGADMEGLIQSLLDVYDVDYDRAKKSCEAFIAKLSEAEVIE